ncbi:MAG TPA: hypothetical protein VGI92_06285 [Gemmatimonadales bacterium]|jgi:hypothetical protein
MSRKTGLQALLVGSLIAVSACASNPAPGRVEVVDRSPPVAVVETYGVAPSPRHVWVAGYYRWEGGNYVWAPGHWEVPPGRYHRWEAGRWVHARRGWYFREGRWR